MGFPDPPEMTMRDRFQAKYRGLRVSFGYPACPDLEDQAKLFALLHPEDIGVQLTEGYTSIRRRQSQPWYSIIRKPTISGLIEREDRCAQ